MEYNGIVYDPYEILGLPHGSRIELVKATYRSLIKIYHPDVFKDDKKFAEERVSLLNAAYNFLSDSKQKDHYDCFGQDHKAEQTNSTYEHNEQAESVNEAMNKVKDTWEFAADYYPELHLLHNNLKRLDAKTAFSFVIFIIENKGYSRAEVIAQELEDAFLVSKFTDDPEIKSLAKMAIEEGEILFAKELNSSLKILGTTAKPRILSKLRQRFPAFSQRAYHKLSISIQSGENIDGQNGKNGTIMSFISALVVIVGIILLYLDP